MYKLHMGCHRGTLMSRDSGVEEYDTLEEAEEAYKNAKKFWALIGYYVWFAEVRLNGEVVKSWPGTPYY